MKRKKRDDLGGRLINMLRSKYFYYGLVLLLVSIILNTLASWFLLNGYSDKLVVVYDLILDNILYLDVAYLYDIFIIPCFILLAVYILHRKAEYRVGYFLFLFGLFLIIRAFFILTNPIANPLETYDKQIFKSTMFAIGAFPSGHVGLCFLCLLFARGIYRNIITISFIAMVIALFVARGHYTMDIFASIIFAYAVYYFGKIYLEKKFTGKIAKGSL
ncbi:MAG: hypothetical protein ABIH37_05145 [archaeon]